MMNFFHSLGQGLGSSHKISMCNTIVVYNIVIMISNFIDAITRKSHLEESKVVLDIYFITNLTLNKIQTVVRKKTQTVEVNNLLSHDSAKNLHFRRRRGFLVL